MHGDRTDPSVSIVPDRGMQTATSTSGSPSLKYYLVNGGTMIEVGIVGLDTSHADAFARLLEERDRVSVAAVWDDGTVRDEAYVGRFCERHDATRYDDAVELGHTVDAAMVLTADWSRHASLAVPFLERGVPTLVDKPVAGDLEALDALERASSHAPLFGGSAVAAHPEFDSLPVDYSERQVYGAGFNDPFYYGAHVVDPIRRVAGADWASVTPSKDPGQTVDVLFRNDARATVRLDGPDREASFAFLDVSDATRTIHIDGQARESLYNPYLDAFLAVVAGDRDDSHRVLDAASLLLAVHAALERSEPVTPHSETLADLRVDAAAFVEAYEPPV